MYTVTTLNAEAVLGGWWDAARNGEGSLHNVALAQILPQSAHFRIEYSRSVGFFSKEQSSHFTFSISEIQESYPPAPCRGAFAEEKMEPFIFTRTLMQ